MSEVKGCVLLTLHLSVTLLQRVGGGWGGESLGSPWQTSADRWEFRSALEEVAMYPTAYLSGSLSLVGPHLLIKHMNPSPSAPSLP